MHRCLLTLLFALAACTAFAQTYQYEPMPFNNGQWKYRSVYETSGSPDMSISDMLLYADGSEVEINGMRYKNLFIRSHDETGAKPLNYPPQHNVATAAEYTYRIIREDGKKVYMYKNGQDELLYDFTLGIGDTIPVSFVHNYPFSNTPLYVIYKIDTVSIGMKMRKRFFTATSNVYTDSMQVIEGIGSSKGLIMANIPFTANIFSVDTRFTCFTQPGMMYPDTSSTCFYVYPYGTPTEVAPVLRSNEYVFYPNPFSDVLHADMPLMGSEQYVQLYNSTGMLVYEHKADNLVFDIAAAHLQGGMYILVVRNQSGIPIYHKKIVKL